MYVHYYVLNMGAWIVASDSGNPENHHQAPEEGYSISPRFIIFFPQAMVLEWY